MFLCHVITLIEATKAAEKFVLLSSLSDGIMLTIENEKTSS